MPGRQTRETTYVRLPESRIREIDELVASWSQETKAFMRARLNQYRPPGDLINNVLETLLSLFMAPSEKNFNVLNDPEILTDWQRRFEISGHTNPQNSWNKILEKEVSAKDYRYLLSLLNKELVDTHIPVELRDLFEKVYRAHLRKEYLSDTSIPKAPLLLFVGPSGSGKTSTVTQAIEQIIFGNVVQAEIDLQQKREELLADEPFWKTIEEIDPTLAMEISRRKKVKFYKRLDKIPLIRRAFKKKIGQALSTLQEQGIWVDYSVVTPNDFQTALSGEPGNFFKRALGDARRTSIRHIEEAHSAFGKASGRDTGVAGQQRTLSTPPTSSSTRSSPANAIACSSPPPISRNVSIPPSTGALWKRAASSISPNTGPIRKISRRSCAWNCCVTISWSGRRMTKTMNSTGYRRMTWQRRWTGSSSSSRNAP